MDDFISGVEVDMVVKSIRGFSVRNLGTEQWLDQHENIIRLNQQCAFEASTPGKEELTKKLLIENEKTRVLVHEVFSVFVWRKHILVKLMDGSDSHDSILIYSLRYHELVTLALLDTILYHEHGCESLGDVALDLVDYCAQCLTQSIGLCNSPPEEDGSSRPAETMDFRLSIHGLSIVYYLIDRIECLPLGVRSRMLRFHDYPCLLSEILHCRPWQRRTSNGLEKYIDGNWKMVAGDDIIKVTKAEAQTWFALRQLLLNSVVMQCYEWNDFRCHQVSKCLELINDLVLDQLTPLVELKHYLATLSLQRGKSRGAAKKCNFMLEEVPEIQQGLLDEIHNYGAQKLVLEHRKLLIDSPMEQVAKRLNRAYNIERILEANAGDTGNGTDGHHQCGQCYGVATKKCANCELVYYCSRECQVKHWPCHKTFCRANLVKHIKESKK